MSHDNDHQSTESVLDGPGIGTIGPRAGPAHGGPAGPTPGSGQAGRDGSAESHLRRLVLELRVRTLAGQLERSRDRIATLEEDLERANRRMSQMRARYEEVLAGRDCDADVVFSWLER